MSDAYDAGLLNDWGGGNVEWWQDYIRAELERSHEFYAAELTRLRAKVEAADKLAQQSEDYIDGLTTSGHVRAALSAYEGEKE